MSDFEIVVVLVALWLVGFVRAPGSAADWLDRTEAGKTVLVTSTTTLPGIPPFWIVNIQATITESTGTHYSRRRT